MKKLVKPTGTRVVLEVTPEESTKFWKIEVTRRLLTRSNLREKRVNGKTVLRIGV